MIDKHPQTNTFSVTESVAGTEAFEDIELGNPGTPISGSKFLAIEILRINASCTIANAPAIGGRTTGKILDADGNVLATFTAETALATNGAVAVQNMVFDLTDGQGNGILLAKNPQCSVQSSSMGAVQGFSGNIIWRYRAVKSTELIALA